jgi:hypothetical protein
MESIPSRDARNNVRIIAGRSLSRWATVASRQRERKSWYRVVNGSGPWRLDPVQSSDM